MNCFRIKIIIFKFGFKVVFTKSIFSNQVQQKVKKFKSKYLKIKEKYGIRLYEILKIIIVINRKEHRQL
ncbi:hypothetical protein JMUB5056_0392 [Leptotrichia hongkongensis]|uniref:Uncharacterized protein n=1 Tax=Leptotrichia hongkongensis TaxID=554406 RepID=A0A510L4A5_9FUSO|nr:hypothetical protein JMUB5056_0392 [Leptotrichia hongkongensis]